MRQGPRWSQSEESRRADAGGVLVVLKRMRPSRPCGAGPGGPKAKGALTPMRRGPWWSQSREGPLANAAGVP